MLEALFPPRKHERLVRDAAAGALLPLVSPVGSRFRVALLPYRDSVVKACVIEAKFHGSERAFALLAEALASYLPNEKPLVLVPVPLSAKRRRERGYNQAEEIARRVLETLPHAALMPDALARIRDTVPQTSLGGAKRRENMHDAFKAKEGLDPAHTYIVVDDVLTTGATLSAAVAALRAGGAEDVRGVALAH